MSVKKRRTWSAQEKLRIVLSGMQRETEVSELCRREGINPTQYYGWKKQLLGSAGEVFANGSDRPSVKEQRLETELVRAKNVIAEITAENLELEKGACRSKGTARSIRSRRQQDSPLRSAAKVRNR